MVTKDVFSCRVLDTHRPKWWVSKGNYPQMISHLTVSVSGFFFSHVIVEILWNKSFIQNWLETCHVNLQLKCACSLMCSGTLSQQSGKERLPQHKMGWFWFWSWLNNAVYTKPRLNSCEYFATEKYKDPHRAPTAFLCLTSKPKQNQTNTIKLGVTSARQTSPTHVCQYVFKQIWNIYNVSANISLAPFPLMCFFLC